MLSLEIRLALYALLVAGLFGGGYWAGAHHANLVCTARAAALQEAQDKALADAQSRVIAAQAAQARATEQAEKDYADLKTTADDLAGQLTWSLRAYTALRDRRSVSPASGTPAEPPSTGPFAPSASGIAEAAGRAGQACFEDAAELTALQEWVKTLAPPRP